jgi:sec-independent protein translocase protein TatA
VGQLGLPEIILIAVIALLIFGPKKLPELGSGLGKAIKDFKSAMNDTSTEKEPETAKADEKKESPVDSTQPKS